LYVVEPRLFGWGSTLVADLLKVIFQINRIQARALRLRSMADWMNFVESCYSLACVNEKDNWTSVSGQKQRFLEWMTKSRKDPTYFEFDETKFLDHIFCTVFDTQRNNRLIIDGLHRANALTLDCNEERKQMTIVTIVECFGERVDIIYPCDIHQLPKKTENYSSNR
jgi:hypothetical protein